jgi:hypothetical protein
MLFRTRTREHITTNKYTRIRKHQGNLTDEDGAEDECPPPTRAPQKF